MATPALAGTIALLRQYLVQARSLIGTDNATEAGMAGISSPKAALVKALAIGGADPTHTFTAQGDLDTSFFAKHIVAPWPLPRRRLTTEPCTKEDSDEWTCHTGYAWSEAVQPTRTFSVQWRVRAGPVLTLQVMCFDARLMNANTTFSVSVTGAEHIAGRTHLQCNGDAEEVVLEGESAVSAGEVITAQVTFSNSVSFAAGSFIMNTLEYAGSGRDRSARQLSCDDTADVWPMKYLAPAAVRQHAPAELRDAFFPYIAALYRVRCPRNCASNGSKVYGTTQYFASSSVCMAADHRGVLGPRRYGGDICVLMLDQQPYLSTFTPPIYPAGTLSAALLSWSAGGGRTFSGSLSFTRTTDSLTEVMTSQSLTTATAAAPGAFTFLVPGSARGIVWSPDKEQEFNAMGTTVPSSYIDAFAYVPRSRPALPHFGPHASEHRAAHLWFGFGTPSLARSIPLAHRLDYSRALVLSTADDLPITHGRAHTHCFVLSTTNDDLPVDSISVTLAWTDPAPSPAAFAQLVNDLDLELVGHGRDDASMSSSLAGNGIAGGDRNNNVEKVVVLNATARSFCARVHAHRVIGWSQKYALVAHTHCEGGCICSLQSGTCACPVAANTTAHTALRECS